MKIRIAACIAMLALLLLLASDALAMSSANYRLDWFAPLTGSGGGQMSSASYQTHVTIGQTAVGAPTSASYRVGLGYWYGLLPGGRLNLPLIVR
jgi:hypothetical protein